MDLLHPAAPDRSSRFESRRCVESRTGALAALLTVCVAIAALLLPGAARAQDLEPRSYSNSPVGLNFALAGYAYTEGSVSFDPAVPLTNANLHTNSLVLGYSRSFALWGNSASFAVAVPYTKLAGSALYVGQPKTREIAGFGDPRFRISTNFYGSPALSAKEFGGYRQDLIIGASFVVSAPWSQNDPTRLVNIGTNRWGFKSEIGVSKAWGSWILEIAPGVTFFTDNDNFLNGGKLQQDPLYSVQGHLVHLFSGGVWAAFDTTFYAGGRTTINGDKGDTFQAATRAGVTVSIPVDRYNSVKLYGSGGTSSRTGSSYNAVGVAWQYRWGGGF